MKANSKRNAAREKGVVLGRGQGAASRARSGSRSTGQRIEYVNLAGAVTGASPQDAAVKKDALPRAVPLPDMRKQ